MNGPEALEYYHSDEPPSGASSVTTPQYDTLINDSVQRRECRAVLD